ncbi:MAG: exonuclease domain-containing protein [Saprospiraceae bacterium]
MSKKEKIYTIVDIETTGGLSSRDRITEIAMVKIKDGVLIDKYESLVNPGRSIPAEITRITGITNSMVANAPMFYEIAKQIVEFTEDSIFVAHNVRFDYNFIREEFKSLGYTYSKKILCTVKLTRKAFPGLRSYSLGNLIQHFDIRVANRHRAMDDVLATWDIFQRILTMEQDTPHIEELLHGGIKELNLPGNLSLEYLHGLPEDPGVYYFYNIHGTVIYVGKSINIKSRIFQHFGKIDSKTEKLARQTHSISYECTGNELVAMLLESKEIKSLHPEINKAQRTKDYPYFVYSYEDDHGYICFNFDRSGKKNEHQKTVLTFTATKQSAKSLIFQACTLFQLCFGKCSLNECGKDCFYIHSQECEGASLSLEMVETYNAKASLAKAYLLKIFQEDFYLVLEGKVPNEHALVLIENGHYRGFGYILKDNMDQGFEEWAECIDYVKPTPEYDRIISQYLIKEPTVKKVNI